DVQILSIVARFRDHQAGEIQPAPVLDVFGVHVISGSRDLQGELVGGAEEPGAAITDLHVDAEALAPFAVDLADVDHAANTGLPLPWFPCGIGAGLAAAVAGAFSPLSFRNAPTISF